MTPRDKCGYGSKTNKQTNTGVVAKADVQESLVNALETGADLANKFVDERLAGDEEHGPSKSFYDKVPRANIKTMADMNKGVKIKSKYVFVSGEAMYVRLLAINSKKKVPLGRVMSFKNSPVLQSLFNDDGSMIFWNKAIFMHKLEGLISDNVTTTTPNADAIIFDANAVIQMLCPPSKPDITYSDMAKAFQDHICQVSKSLGGSDISQIHVVFDRYLTDSIKGDSHVKNGHTTFNPQFTM